MSAARPDPVSPRISPGRRVARFAGHSFLAAPITADSVVIDLGVNHGEFATSIIERFGCRVVGVEPVAELRRVVPPDPRLTVEPLAITGDGRPVTLFVNHTTCATIDTNLTQSGAPSVAVQSTTLAELLDRHHIEQAALIKVDIEGAELEMIEAADDATLRRADQMTIEFHEFLDPRLAAPTRRARQRMRAAGFAELAMSRDTSDVLFVNSQRLAFGPARRAALAAGHKYPQGIGRYVGRRLSRRPGTAPPTIDPDSQ